MWHYAEERWLLTASDETAKFATKHVARNRGVAPSGPEVWGALPIPATARVSRRPDRSVRVFGYHVAKQEQPRQGRAATSRGAAVSPGVGQYYRTLSVRITPYELWSPLRVLKSADAGRERLRRLHGRAIDADAFRRFAAYLSQAETFYLSADRMAPESRPLVAYYFMLNMSKAVLTCLDPPLTEQRAFHGLKDGFTQRQRYWFQHEAARVLQTRPNSTNVFRELAERTGAGYCPPAGTELPIHKLMPYLVETADLIAEATNVAPKLIPIDRLDVVGRAGRAWLRVEIAQGDLRQRGLSATTLLKRARHFSDVFRDVESPEPRRIAAYESVDVWSYRNPKTKRYNYALCFPHVRDAFEQSLIHSNRGTTGTRHLIILSDRAELLSQEAVCFLVMHHLSNMVRYRPEQVAKLSGKKWFFLFTAWVPRAMENFLLASMSRILHEEVRVA